MSLNDECFCTCFKVTSNVLIRRFPFTAGSGLIGPCECALCVSVRFRAHMHMHAVRAYGFWGFASDFLKKHEIVRNSRKTIRKTIKTRLPKGLKTTIWMRTPRRVDAHTPTCTHAHERTCTCTCMRTQRFSDVVPRAP